MIIRGSLNNKFKYINIKQSVLLRLIKNGESLEDASSKAGLCINLAKDYLKPKNPFAIY